MKQVKKKIWMLAMLVTFCPMIALAQEETKEPANQEDPEVSVPEIREVSLIVGELTGGTISLGDQIVSETDPNKVVVTITVTPADGFKISKENIKLWAVLPLPVTPPNGTRGPEVSGELELEGDEPDNLSEKRDYQVTIDPNLDIWVEVADFQKVEETVQPWNLTEGVLTISGEIDTEADVPWDSESVTSVVIAYDEQVLDLEALGISEETSVEVPGRLLSEYVFNYKGYKIDCQGKTEITGFSFGESNSYDTFVSDADVIVPSMLKAYVITNITEEGLTLKEVTSIAKGQAVLVFTEDKYKDIENFYTVTTDPVEPGSNLLQVAPAGGQPVTIGEVFMLYNDVFYYTQAGTIPEGSVYLTKPSAVKTRGFYALGGDDDTTGIDARRIVTSSQQSAWYTLDGRRLDTMPTRKGIYIKDGKKIIIK